MIGALRVNIFFLCNLIMYTPATLKFLTIYPKSALRNCSRQHSNFYYFSEKIRLGILCESSARQMIHMKCQALFSLKTIKRGWGIKVPSAAVVVSTLRFSLGDSILVASEKAL